MQPVASGITSPGPSSTHSVVPDSVMRVKAVDKKGLAMTSEAEALRKNPLKNHALVTDELDES